MPYPNAVFLGFPLPLYTSIVQSGAIIPQSLTAVASIRIIHTIILNNVFSIFSMAVRIRKQHNSVKIIFRLPKRNASAYGICEMTANMKSLIPYFDLERVCSYPSTKKKHMTGAVKYPIASNTSHNTVPDVRNTWAI